jgi:uncharacterized protein
VAWPVEDMTRDVSARLATLGRRQNAAFSASCAERLMPLYQKFCTEQKWDGNQQLRDILNNVWGVLRDPAIAAPLEDWLSGTEALVPHADDFASALITAAQDCVICTDLAVRWLLGRQALPSASPEYALEGILSTEAARRTGFLSFGSTQDDQAKENQIIGLSTVQNELACQRQDVATLAAAGDAADVAEDIRVKARGDAHK